MTGIGKHPLSKNEITKLCLMLGRLQDGDHFDIAEMAGELKYKIKRARNTDGIIIRTSGGFERQIIPEREITEILLDGSVIYQSQ